MLILFTFVQTKNYNMKTIFLSTIILQILLIPSLFAQKQNAILTQKLPYDSINNFVKGDLAQYTGQELWLKSLPENQQELGYANFLTNFKKFDNLNDGKNVYKCCDGYNSKYSELENKHFYVEMVFTNERKDKSTREKVTDTFFKLIEKSSGDALYYFIDPTMSEYTFPFVVMGYLEKQKNILKDRKFVFAEEIIINSKDINTRKAIKAELGSIWNYIDITVDKYTCDLSLIAKDKKGQTISVSINEVLNTNSPKKVYLAEEAKKMLKRFGEFNYARILQQKIASNMNKDAIKLSWGEPIEIIENGTGNRKTETWIYTMGKITFRGNTIIKIE